MDGLKKTLLSLLSLFSYSYTLCMHVPKLTEAQLCIRHQLEEHKHDDELCPACIEIDARTQEEPYGPKSLLEAARLGDFSDLPNNVDDWKAIGLDANMYVHDTPETKEEAEESALPIYQQNNSPYRIPELATPQKQHRSVDTGKTLLHYAVQFNNIPIIELLLAAGADPSIADDNNKIPVFLAIDQGYGRATELLLTAHQKNCSIRKDGLSFCLRNLAMRTAGPVVLNSLIKFGADPNQQNISNKTTALHFAAFFDQADAIALLIEHDAHPGHQDSSGRTPLCTACAATPCSVAAAQQLLTYDAVRASINQQDCDGNTALHYAAHEGHEGLIQTLLACGADTSIINNNGCTAYNIAQDAYKKSKKKSSRSYYNIAVIQLFEKHRAIESGNYVPYSDLVNPHNKQ